MRIFTIGATGFIGPYVVRQLVESGHHVAVFSRGGKKPVEHERVRAIQGDRDRIVDYRREIESFQPDAVIDFIAFTEKQTRELVNLLEGVAQRLVVLSSCDVYRNYDGLTGRWEGGADPTPLDEDGPRREYLYPYRGEEGLERFKYRDEYEKLLVERAALGGRGVQATILRLPAVYGPGDNQHRLQPYLQQMDAGEKEIHIGSARASWRWTRGYVENVAAAIVVAATHPKAAGRTYNIGDQPTLTEREWIERIGRTVGWEGRVVVDEEDDDTAKWEYNLDIDSTRIRERLEYAELVDWEDALSKTIEWTRKRGD